MFTTIFLDSNLKEEELYRLFEAFYEDHSLLHLTHVRPNLRQVVNTNHCLIHLERHERKLFIVSILDNLLKGAAG